MPLNSAFWHWSIWPWPWFKITRVQENKLLRQLSHKVCDRFTRNLVYCWDLLVWWTSFSCHPFSIQRREPYLCDFVKKKPITLVCIQTCIDQFLSNLLWWYHLISFWWRPSFKVSVLWEIKNISVHILRNFAIDLNVLKLMLNLFCARERTLLTWFDKMYDFWIDLFQTWYNARHDLTLQFDSSLNDRDASSRSPANGKGRTCAFISVEKLHEATQMFVMADYVRKMTVRKPCMANMDRWAFALLDLQTFQLIRRTFEVVLRQASWYYCRLRLVESREITAVLLTASKETKNKQQQQQPPPPQKKTTKQNKTKNPKNPLALAYIPIYLILHFENRLMDLDLDSRLQEYEKSMSSVPIVSHQSHSIWMEVATVLRIVGMRSDG